MKTETTHTAPRFRLKTYASGTTSIIDYDTYAEVCHFGRGAEAEKLAGQFRDRFESHDALVAALRGLVDRYDRSLMTPSHPNEIAGYWTDVKALLSRLEGK